MAKKQNSKVTAAISVKLPMDVVISARTIAGIENRAIADVIADAARDPLAKMERAALARRSKEVEIKP